MSSYIKRTVAAMAREMPGEDPSLVRLYALLALTRGRATTRQDVHDAWALWRTATRSDHPSIVPFDQLSADVQALDQPYVDAIHRAVAALNGQGGEAA